MARHRTKKRASAKHRSNAGRPAHRRKAVMHHRRRHNPALGLGSPMNWVEGGVGVLAGVAGCRGLPQLILPTSNTGALGYGMNALATIACGVVARMIFPRRPVVTAGVVAGGFAALIARIIGDQTPYGKFLSLPQTGLGDYNMNFHFAIPQRLGRDLRSVEIPQGWGASAVAAPGGGLAGGMDSASIC